MKKKFSIIIFLLLALLIALFFLSQKNEPTTSYNTENTEENVNKEQMIDISFEFDGQDPFSTEYLYSGSQSLFALSKKISSEQGWDFLFEDYGDMGILITQIQYNENGQDGKYWQYFVDDVQPQISVEKYFPENNANIKWKFIESEF